MAISNYTKEFLEGLIDYYVNEASSYKQLAEQYTPEINSVADAAFGIIAGCIYSSFLQAYANQKQKVGLDDLKDFHNLLKQNSSKIKRAILEDKDDSET